MTKSSKKRSYNRFCRLMEASADEVGRILPVFSPKTAGKICLVDGLVIDLLVPFLVLWNSDEFLSH